MEIPSSNNYQHHWKVRPEAALETREYSTDNSKRRGQRDLLRRIALLESKQKSLESIVRIGTCLTVVGSAAITYQNWDAIQKMADKGLKKIPPGIKTSCQEAWAKFTSYFQK